MTDHSRKPLNLTDLLQADGTIREIAWRDVPVEVCNRNTVQDACYRANEQIRQHNQSIARGWNPLTGTSTVERAIQNLEIWIAHANALRIRRAVDASLA